MHGETFNGDGTSPNAATVAGGVGAFNNLLDIFQGNESSITSVDSVHVYTGDGVTNPSMDWSNISWGFQGSFIDFDDAVEFASAGMFSLRRTASGTTSTAYGSDGQSINYNRRATMYWTLAGDQSLSQASGVYTSGLIIDDELTDGHNSARTLRPASSGSRYSRIVDYKWIIRGASPLSSRPLMSLPSGDIIDGFVFDFRTSSTVFMFAISNNRTIMLNNIDIVNDSSNHVLSNFDDRTSFMTINGLNTSNGLIELKRSARPTERFLSNLQINNFTRASNSAFGTYSENYSAIAESSPVLNFPYLNALQPNSNNQGFSVRIRPVIIRENVDNETMKSVKLDTVGGSRNITVNMLLPVEYLNPLRSEFYMRVTYFDSSGVQQSAFSDRTETALQSSSAAWSALVYGANSFSAFEMTLNGLDVKQDTLINITVMTRKVALTNEDFYFVDPDISLT